MTDRPFAELNPEVSIGLEDIVRKCLIVRPTGAYHSAAALADDLRRHVQNQPLRGVPNRSGGALAEVASASIPPPTLGAAGTRLLLVAIAWFLVFSYTQRVHEIETDLKEGQRILHQRTVRRRRPRSPPGPRSPPRRSLRSPACPGHSMPSSARRYASGMWPSCTTWPSGSDSTMVSTRPRGARHRPCSATFGRSGIVAISYYRRSRLRSTPSSIGRSGPTCKSWWPSGPRFGLASRPRTRRRVPRAEAIDLLNEARACCGPSFAIDHLRRSIAKEQGVKNRIDRT